MKNLIENIKKLRKEKNLFLKDVSEKLNISLAAYNQIELGNTAVSVERLYQFANIFNVSVWDLLGESIPVAVVDSTEVENLRKEVELLRKENDLLNINNNNILLFLYKEIGINLGLWESQNFEMDSKKNLVLKKEFANKIEEQFFEIDFVLEMFEKDLVDNIHFKEMFEEYKKRKER